MIRIRFFGLGELIQKYFSAAQYPRKKGRGKDRKGKGKEGIHPQSRLSASETPNAEGYGHAWELDDWSASHWLDESWTSAAGWSCTRAHAARMVATPLNLANHPTHVVLDLGCTRSIGSRAAIEIFTKHAWYYGITTEFCRCISPLCSPTPRQKLAWKVALSTFQQHHHVPPRLMCLRQVNCPSCFPSFR